MLLRTLRPDLNPPSADTMARVIQKEFENIRIQVRNKLADVHCKISLTLDCWTSEVNTKSFLGVSAHWISNWRMQEIILDFVDLSGIAHTGINLAKALEHLIDDMQLSNKILSIVVDSTSNNDSLFEKLQYDEIHQVRCFGHVLNLVVQGI